VIGRDAITTFRQHKYGESQLSFYQFQSIDQSAYNTVQQQQKKQQSTIKMAVKVFRFHLMILS